MPTELVNSEALTEVARELCELAKILNHEAEPAELMDLAAAADSTLAGLRVPDSWLVMEITKAGQQLR